MAQNKELIAFRGMVLGVIFGFSSLTVSGYYKYQISLSVEDEERSLKNVAKCLEEDRHNVPACVLSDASKGNEPLLAEACSIQINQECNFWKFTEEDISERDSLSQKQRVWSLIGEALVAASITLFYGLRWVLTGRIRPLKP